MRTHYTKQIQTMTTFLKKTSEEIKQQKERVKYIYHINTKHVQYHKM